MGFFARLLLLPFLVGSLATGCGDDASSGEGGGGAMAAGGGMGAGGAGGAAQDPGLLDFEGDFVLRYDAARSGLGPGSRRRTAAVGSAPPTANALPDTRTTAPASAPRSVADRS